MKFRALPQPWPVGSRDRQYRLSKLCEALLSTNYDIISLQEVFISAVFILFYDIYDCYVVSASNFLKIVGIDGLC